MTTKKDNMHLLWILWGAVVGFATSFIFGDLWVLPADLYYLIYFGVVLLFFAVYIRKTRADLKGIFSKLKNSAGLNKR